MRIWRQWILYAVCLPWDLLVWGIFLVLYAVWGTRLEWETPSDNPAWKGKRAPGGPCLTFDLKPESWIAKRGRFSAVGMKGRLGGMTLGHAIMYGPEKRPIRGVPWVPVQVHEHVHVEQHEAAMLRALLVAIPVAAVGQSTASLVTAGLIWLTGYFQMGVAGWLTAWLRGESLYRGSVHEEAAYAIDDVYEQEQKEK